MCTVCSSADVQTKFYLLPRFLNPVSCYNFNGWCDPFLQLLDIPYLLSIHNVLNVPPQEKSRGERSGLRGGQGIGPPLPIQASENLSFKMSVTKQLKCGGAPSCIKITLLNSFLFEGFNLWNRVNPSSAFYVIAVSNPVHLFRWPCITIRHGMWYCRSHLRYSQSRGVCIIED